MRLIFQLLDHGFSIIKDGRDFYASKNGKDWLITCELLHDLDCVRESALKEILSECQANDY